MYSIIQSTAFKLFIVFILVWTGINPSVRAQTPTVQDCLGAIPICEDSITIGFSHNGMGNYSNEIASVSGCYAPEQRSVWFKFTVQQAGLLRFEINPLNNNQDHDWTLFDLTTGSCSQLSTYAGASSKMVRSNTWGAWGFNGPTGVSTPNGGTGTCNGPGGTNGPKWCADLPVAVGSTYYLHITNWTGSVYGFTIDFSSSTAVLYDQTPPAMDSISSSVNCHIFDSIVVDFDEDVVCSSLHTGDFNLSGPSGNHTITSVSGVNCTGGNASSAVIHFSPAVSQIGQYALTIKPGAGYIEDVCGNLDTLDTMSFFFDGYIETNITPDHIECWQECDGAASVAITGGATPFDYNWSTGATSTSIANLCAGTYGLTVTDDVGCEVIDSIEILQPDDIVTTLVSDYMTSCPNTTNCDGGATVIASGGVAPYYYSWSSGEVGASPSALCEGSNFVTVTDVNGCLDTFEVVIETPDSILTVAAGDTMICISNSTSIAASATGGTAPYNYIWHHTDLNGQVISTAQVTTVAPVTTTNYMVQVVDDKGCIGDTSQVLIKVRSKLGIDFPHVDTICPYDTIDVTVQGTGGDSNYTFSWGNGQFGSTITISPDQPRWFRVTVADACGTPPYQDSLFVQVGGYSAIDVTLRGEDDSICAGESVYIIASGRGGHKGPKEYEFNWGHTSDQNPIQFVRPNKTTTYFTTISDLCLSEHGTQAITIHVGNKETPELSADPKQICGASEVSIRIEAFNSKSEYDWYFSDASSFLDYPNDSITKLFKEPGCYDVTIHTTTAYGCVSSAEFDCLFTILQEPTAAFNFDPANPTNTNPYVSVINRSVNDEERVWFFGSQKVKDEEIVYRYFDEEGADSLVTLAVMSSDGCVDTLTRHVPFLIKTLLYYPKSFTPNGDGLNDAFGINGEAISNVDFLLEVYDRWGEVVFTADDPTETWDGKGRGGERVQIGAYPFMLRYRDHLGEIRVVRDQVLITKTGTQRGLR
ncbi:MAG: gliding motility-associated C-terminal domain-containing protein [Cryomorphaceae bacterium]